MKCAILSVGDVFTRDRLGKTGVITDTLLIRRITDEGVQLARVQTSPGWADVSCPTLPQPNLIELADYRRADFTAWAEAVAKLTDYLLALPSEAME